MKAHTQQILLDTYRHKTLIALGQFQQAQQQLQQHQQQLQQLNEFRSIYVKQALDRGAGGLEANNFHLYQKFIVQLEDASKQQTNQLSGLENAQQQAHKSWMQAQAKQQSLEKLIEKNNQKALEKIERQEQKDQDEFQRRKRNLA